MNNRKFPIFVVTGVTLVALTYALWEVDLRHLGRVLANANYNMLAPLLGLTLVFFWLKAMRWILLLRPLGQYTEAQVVPAMMIGFAGNNLLPCRIGELIRTGVFARQYSCSISSVLLTVVIERIFDMAAIITLYDAAVFALDSVPQLFEIAACLISFVFVIGYWAVTAVVGRPRLIQGLFQQMDQRLPSRWQGSLRNAVRNTIDAVSVLNSAHLVLRLFALSLLKWALIGIIVWCCVSAFNHSVPLQVCLVVLGVLNFASGFPSAPGFIGTIQAAFVFALQPFGVPEEVAFAASVLFLVGQWVPVTAVGSYFFIVEGLRFSDLRKNVEEVEEASVG